jgi:hypothetical protein
MADFFTLPTVPASKPLMRIGSANPYNTDLRMVEVKMFLHRLARAESRRDTITALKSLTAWLHEVDAITEEQWIALFAIVDDYGQQCGETSPRLPFDDDDARPA